MAGRDPDQLKFTAEHLWIDIEGNLATIGIADFAQKELGEVAYIELPELGLTVEQQDIFCTIESVKSTSDLLSPLSGSIRSTNEALAEFPETVNNDPYGEGWLLILEISRMEETGSLMEYSAYEKLIQS